MDGTFLKKKPANDIPSGDRKLKAGLHTELAGIILLLGNERPRGKPRGITERNPQEHTQQAAGYSSSRKSGIKMLRGCPAEQNVLQ